MRLFDPGPAKPKLSPTRFSTYLACPTKYRWTYLDARGHWLKRAKPYYSFGTSLHKVLERFHDSNDTGVTTVAEASAALDEGWIEAGYDSADHMAQALGEGKDLLEMYVEESLTHPIESSTLYVEKTFSRDMGPFILFGRIDRVEEHKDGTLEVVDYKTGESKWTEEILKTDIAMCVYQYLLARAHPGRKVCATIYSLRSGTRVTARLEPEDMELFERDLIELGQEIINREWDEVEPVAKALCRRCDFLPLCSRHPDFQLG